MKTEINSNGLIITPQSRTKKLDNEIISFINSYNLLNQIRKNSYFIQFEKLMFLYEENEIEILNNLNIIYPFIFDKFEISLNSINKIDLNSISFFYENKSLFLYQKYFFSNEEKNPKFILINDAILDIINLITDINLKYETKISKLYKLSNNYGFNIKSIIKYDYIKDYNIDSMQKDNSILFDFLLLGVPDRYINKLLISGIAYKDSTKTGKSAYILDEDTQNDLKNLENFRDKTKPYKFQFNINSDNINEFYNKMQLNFSETLFEKISDRLENIIFTTKKFTPEIISSGLAYLIFLDENTINILPTEKLNESLYKDFEKIIFEAIISNKRIIYFDNKWYDISEIIEQYKRKNKEEHPIKQIIIKSNQDKLDYVKYKNESKKENLYELDISFLNPNLFDYQRDGVKKILNAYFSNYSGFLLADDMGLGKTIQILMIIKYFILKNDTYKVLIVCPKSLINNWKDEISKHTPELNKFVINELNNNYVLPKFIFIINYDSLIQNEQYLKYHFDILIADEVQRMKTYSTKTSRFMKAISASFKIALTATPIENNIIEFWNIIDFILPGFLGSKKKFKEDYLIINEKPSSDLAYSKANELMKKIETIFLRREKNKTTSLNLPIKYTKYEKIELNKEHAFSYISIYKSIDPGKILPAVQILLQVCDCPYNKVEYVNCEEYEKYSSKIKYLIKILENIKEKNEKALIFTRFIKTQIYIKEILEKHSIKAEILNGSLDNTERQEIINNFNHKNEIDTLIINPKIGGIGLNLVSANNVIHYTLEWNHAVISQATDRVYRIGQTKDVFNYILYTGFPENFSNKSRTVEEYLVELIRKKEEISNFLINTFYIQNELKSIEKELVNDLRIS